MPPCEEVLPSLEAQGHNGPEWVRRWRHRADDGLEDARLSRKETPGVDRRLIDRVSGAVGDAAGRYHRLVLFAGASGSGKTRILREAAAARGAEVLNLNLRLSEQLLDVPRKERPVQTARMVADLLDATSGDPLFVDNLEILFSPDLGLDPLRVLQQSSRNRTIVATWAGTHRNGTLTYAASGHPEARSYQDVDAVIVDATDGGGASAPPAPSLPGSQEVP
jgi:hypothetical protein